MEPTRPVHAPWVELTKEHDIKWEPSWQDKYTGPQGGPPAGPTQFIVDIVRSAKGLANIFFAILPLTFFERVAQLTTKYCYDDWVVQRRKKDSDGNEMKQFYYVQVSPLSDGAPTPNRRHRADNKRVRYSITTGFTITWIEILILQGAHFGSDKRTSHKMWQKTPYGLSLPYVRNSMSRDAYEFLRRNLHFADNYKQQP